MATVLPATHSAIEDEIRQKFMGGMSLPALCKAYTLPRMIVAGILDHPDVRALMAKKAQSLGSRALMFKMQAFEHAEDGLEALADLAKTASDESLRRKCWLDVIRLASLEPRKVIVVNKTVDHGITEETKQWFEEVLVEAGVKVDSAVIDAEVNPAGTLNP